jgi:hypothetical protein
MSIWPNDTQSSSVFIGKWLLHNTNDASLHRVPTLFQKKIHTEIIAMQLYESRIRDGSPMI